MKSPVPKVDIDRALVEAIALHPARLAKIEREVTAFDREHETDCKEHRDWQKSLQKNYTSSPASRFKLNGDEWIPAQLFKWLSWWIAFQVARYRLRRCRVPQENWEPAHITQMRLARQFYLANRAVVMENEFDRSLDMDTSIVMMLDKRDLSRYEHELTRFRMAAHEMDFAQLRVI